MRAMILAAGRGRRLQPLTDTLPKPLVPIAGKPLIEYHLEHLAAAGIIDIVINVAHLGQLIIDTLGNGEKFGVNIQYSREPQPLEVAGGIIQALPLLGSQPFLIVNGDVWTDFPFAYLKEYAQNLKTHAHLIMVDNPSKNPLGDFGLLGNKLLEDDSQPKLTYSGIALFTPEFFAGCTPGSRPMRPLLDAAIAAGTISAEYYAGEWNDVGTIQCWQQLNERLRKVEQL